MSMTQVRICSDGPIETRERWHETIINLPGVPRVGDRVRLFQAEVYTVKAVEWAESFSVPVIYLWLYSV